MSLEAWGSDDDYQVPEGYVTDERADEMVKEAVEAALEKAALIADTYRGVGDAAAPIAAGIRALMAASPNRCAGK